MGRGEEELVVKLQLYEELGCEQICVYGKPPSKRRPKCRTRALMGVEAFGDGVREPARMATEAVKQTNVFCCR